MASNTVNSDDQPRQQGYQPKTVKQRNHGRYAYLPLYTAVVFGPNNHLLLANVPVTRLASHEIIRRHNGAFTSDAILIMNDYDYANNKFSLTYEDAEELAVRLQVGKSIIIFNAKLLRTICYSLVASHQIFRRNVLLKPDIALKEPTLNSRQMVIALEFFLQMDVDIFYLKTCSFRGAEPLSKTEGLFCGKHEPEERYILSPCGNLLCPCCHPLNSAKKSQPWSVVDILSSSMHQFINGYTTYLNCPVTCNTANIIYTMTCPCGQYDYVDSTALTLADAMTYHRQHGNRIIHERLTGNPVFRGSILDPIERENTMADKMRLYQHSARCPVALRSFLDCNPDYWCFIPMLMREVSAENALYLQRPFNADHELADVIAMGAIDDHAVVRYLYHVPVPPTGYGFSFRQKQKQRFVFESLASSTIQQLPYDALDLYKMSIIAVLPEDCSTMLRYIIETLFIIHGETKLNMICPLGGDPERLYGRAYDLVWCANMNPRLVSSTTSNQ